MRFIKHTNQTHTLTQTRTHKYSKWVMQAYLQAAHRSWNRQSALRVIQFYNGEWDLFWLIGITHRRSLVPKQQNDGDGSSVVICISPVSSHFVTWFTDWLIRSQFCGLPPCLSDDPLFSVLHLWSHCRDLKRPVCSGTEQTAGQDANNSPGCNDSGLSR